MITRLQTLGTCEGAAEAMLRELPDAFTASDSARRTAQNCLNARELKRKAIAKWIAQAPTIPPCSASALSYTTSNSPPWIWLILLALSFGLHAAFIVISSALMSGHHHEVREHPRVATHAHNPVTLTSPPVIEEIPVTPQLQSSIPAPVLAASAKTAEPPLRKQSRASISNTATKPAQSTPQVLENFAMQSPGVGGSESPIENSDLFSSGDSADGTSKNRNGREGTGETAQKTAAVVKPPKLQGEVLQPAYPPHLRRQGIEGTVVLRVSTDERGRVTVVKVIQSSGHGEFDQSAVKTAYTYQFEPAKREGKAVPGSAKITSNFRIRD